MSERKNFCSINKMIPSRVSFQLVKGFSPNYVMVKEANKCEHDGFQFKTIL